MVFVVRSDLVNRDFSVRFLIKFRTFQELLPKRVLWFTLNNNPSYFLPLSRKTFCLAKLSTNNSMITPSETHVSVLICSFCKMAIKPLLEKGVSPFQAVKKPDWPLPELCTQTETFTFLMTRFLLLMPKSQSKFTKKLSSLFQNKKRSFWLPIKSITCSNATM